MCPVGELLLVEAVPAPDFVRIILAVGVSAPGSRTIWSATARAGSYW